MSEDYLPFHGVVTNRLNSSIKYRHIPSTRRGYHEYLNLRRQLPASMRQGLLSTEENTYERP